MEIAIQNNEVYEWMQKSSHHRFWNYYHINWWLHIAPIWVQSVVHADTSPKSYQTKSKTRHFTFFGFGKIGPSISLQRAQIVQKKFGLTLKLLHWSCCVNLCICLFTKVCAFPCSKWRNPHRTHMGQLTSKSRVIHVHPMLVDQETENIKSLRRLGCKRHRRTPAN